MTEPKPLQTLGTEALEAAKLLLERRKARKELIQWSRLCGYEPAAHQRLLIEKLEAVVRGEIYRLMVIMPPGSAKSTYSSMLFPPWFLAQSPNSRILTASHSADLAEDFGRKARNLIKEHSNALGYALREDSQAAGRWATTHQSEYMAAGVGKSIAGFRADLGLIDDPVGSREDAWSEVIQKRNYNWYKTDFRSRLKPNAKVVLIQTRWHELDLAGCILRDEGSEWTVIQLPMLAGPNDPLGRVPGEMLWKEYFNDRLLADAKKDPMVWSSLYQGDPTPADGDYFRREWIESHTYEQHELPDLKEMRVYVASDHAVSIKEEADFSAMIPFGVDHRGTIWILPDIVWDKLAPLETVSTMIDLMRRRRPITWWAEDEKITKAIGPFLNIAMQEAGVYSFVEPIKPAKDKMTRAQSIRGRMASGQVRFPRFHSRFGEILAQFLKFPAGAHDDVVDAFAYIGLGLDKMGKGSLASLPPSEDFSSPVITMRWIKNNCRLNEHERQLAFLDN